MALTQAAYARHRAKNGLRGVTRQAVSKRIKAGDLDASLVREGGAVLIGDPALADTLWTGNTDEAKARTKPGPETEREIRPDGQARATSTVNCARIKKLEADAAMSRLRFEREAGKLVERKAVENSAFTAMREAREVLRSMGSRLASKLAMADSPKQAQKIINTDVESILNTLAKKFNELPNAGTNPIQSYQPTTKNTS